MSDKYSVFYYTCVSTVSFVFILHLSVDGANVHLSISFVYTCSSALHRVFMSSLGRGEEEKWWELVPKINNNVIYTCVLSKNV